MRRGAVAPFGPWWSRSGADGQVDERRFDGVVVQLVGAARQVGGVGQWDEVGEVRGGDPQAQAVTRSLRG